MLAKSGLTTHQIGLYESFLFVVGGLSFFWISGLLQAFLPMHSSVEEEDNKTPLIFNAFLLMLFFSVLSILAILLFEPYIANIFTKSAEIPYFNWLLIYLLFSSPSSMIEYIYLLKNKAEWIYRYGILSFFIQFSLVVIPVIAGLDLQFAIIGLVISSAFRFVWLLWLISKYSKYGVSFAYLKEHLKLGYPLILSTLLSGSGQYIDGIIVSSKFNLETFAIFRYGAREFPIVLLLANAFSNAMIPIFSAAKDISEPLAKIKSRSKGLMHFLFPLTLLFLISSNWLYPLIFNHNFILSAKVFNIYLLLIISKLIFPQTIIIGMKRTTIIMWAALAEIILNVSLSLILVNYIGILGVAYATIIAYLFERVLLIIYAKKVLKISTSSYIPWKTYSYYTILTIITYSLGYFVFY